jgi:hypothetical protein
MSASAFVTPQPPTLDPNYTPMGELGAEFVTEPVHVHEPKPIRTPSNLCLSCAESPTELVAWPCDFSADLYRSMLRSKVWTLGDFVKRAIRIGRANKKKMKMSWPDFCVNAAKRYSIINEYDIQRPDVWRDQMFILSLVASWAK